MFRCRSWLCCEASEFISKTIHWWIHNWQHFSVAVELWREGIVEGGQEVIVGHGHEEYTLAPVSLLWLFQFFYVSWFHGLNNFLWPHPQPWHYFLITRLKTINSAINGLTIFKCRTKWTFISFKMILWGILWKQLKSNTFTLYTVCSVGFE